MRRLIKRIEAALAAVAFAEEGEVEMARQVLADGDRGDATPSGAPGRKAARDPAPLRALPREKIARLP